MKKKISVLTLLAMLIALASGCTGSKTPSDSTAADTSSETWVPKKAVTMIVPFSAGGGVDVTARIYAKYFEKHTGVNMVVNNLTGGGGVVGYSEFSTSRPDGYTLTIVTTPAIQNQYMYDGIPYTEDTFAPVGMLTYDPSVMCVQVGSKYDVEPEKLLEMIRDNPGTVSVGCGTTNGVQHLGVMTFEQASGYKTKVVPFDDGGAQTIAGLAGGHIDMSTGFYNECQTFVEEGKLRVVWTCGDERPSIYCQDVPTLKELGVDCSFGTFRGVAAVAGTPDDIMEGLIAINDEIIADEEFLAELEAAGAAPDLRDADGLREAMEQVSEDTRATAELLGLI